jgi:HD-GYP domain-containing protein (c-di-GMP phosphodiesterase class II)
MAPVPQDDIHNLDELKSALASDARFGVYHVTGTGDGWVEVRVGEGGLTLAATRLIGDTAAIEPHLVRSAAGKTMLLLVGTDDELTGVEALRDRYELALVTLPLSRARLYVTMKNYLDLVALRAREFERGRTAERYRYELGELVSIARAISSERDIGKLLGLILEKSRYVTGADAGSVYIVEGQALNPRERTVRFMVSQNDSIAIDFSEHTFPVDEKTIVGRAIISRQLINIADLAREKHDRRFDLSSGYQTRSMLTVPMSNQRDEVIGVIQLINRRKAGPPPEDGGAEGPVSGRPPRLKAPIDFDEWVVPFDKRSEDLTTTLAAQAGISLENTLLYEDIRRLFEGFVNASVTAIESRDPTTSGHSQRVATLTVGLAEMVDRTDGPYQSIHFTPDHLKEIEYAALLHDFGKVGVREKVLIKAKKLYEDERDTLLQRFDYIRKWVEADATRRKLDLVLQEGAAAAQRQFAELDADEQRRLVELDDFVAFILKSNEPTVMPEGSFERLAEIAERRFLDPRGEARPFLTPSEMDALKLPRGSLTAEERLEIESHVVHTYNFLENIPWGRRLGSIPTIAGSHHEKLDGSGYPRGLRGDEIRIESRIMTIADIFDALTASDRPYKKAVPLQKALDILGFEVKDGKCDAELLRIFIDSKVWQRVLSA